MKNQITINPFGVQILTSQNGVLISYAFSHDDFIECHFSSVEKALTFYEISSLENLSFLHLLSK
jgi:hypothetical protein